MNNCSCIQLNKESFIRYSVLFIPLFFGLWSLLLGQDRNWDLAAYHFYNGFSFIHNKFDIDLAAAGSHSFFNPLLDAFYYYFNTHLPPKLFGFLLGFIHGLIFVFIVNITKILIPKSDRRPNLDLIFFISFICCLTPNFLAGLGNSMGDNSTALFGICSIWLTISYWNTLGKESLLSNLLILSIGLIMGVGVGLKLTNAPYALALALSLFFYSSKILKNLKIVIVLSLGVLFGIACSAGFWFLNLWEHFHNPFFPQFSNFFPNEFSNIDVIDRRWPPKDLFEAIGWPFITALNYKRVGEGLVHQILWPTFFLLLYIKILFGIFKTKVPCFKTLPDKQFFLILFIAISYVAWMFVFSIQRYIVTIEVLLPLAIYFLLANIFEKYPIKKISIYFLCISASIILFGGFGTWGHARWTYPALKVETPKVLNPETSTVLLTNFGMPITWMITQFDSHLSFVRLGILPTEKQNNFLKKRSGNLFVMFPGAYNWRIDNVHTWTKIVSELGLLSNKEKCEKLQTLIEKIKFRGQIKFYEPRAIIKDQCFIDIKDQDFIDINEANQKIIDFNNAELNSHGFELIKSSCHDYHASIGGQGWSYIFCATPRN